MRPQINLAKINKLSVKHTTSGHRNATKTMTIYVTTSMIKRLFSKTVTNREK